MALFWALAALMTLAAVACVAVPLLRARPAAAPTADEANLEVLRAQRREIDADLAAGVLPEDAREEALAELVQRAGEDLRGAGESAAAAPARRPWPLAAAAAIAIPALAFGTYLAIGNPEATRPEAVAARPAMDDAQIVAMVEALAAKVRERPDDVQGWGLLARSMAALGRFEESAAAYAHLAGIAPGDPQVLADYADALGMAQGRNLAGRPYELARAALAIDPRHRKALALAGTAALDSGDFAAAVGYWERLAAELPAGSADAAQVAAIVGEIRGRAQAEGKALPPAAAPRVAQAPAAAAETVSGSVTVAPAMRERITGGETLFVFARAEGGGRVPLAVVRASARELPLAFALDDSQAMAPGATLSSAAAVRVEARISRSGNATPQPGDLVGTSAVVRPGTRDVRVVVDKVLP